MFVIFATRNGASRSIREMLKSLRALKPPARGFEVIAADSASNDATYALLREAAADLPLTIVRVSQPGKNRALNAALDHVAERLSDRDLVAFTDDDVRVDPNWLVALCDAADLAPQADIFGGRIEPVFPMPPSAALLGLEDRFDVLFARSICPEGPCSARDVFGPNMAIRGRRLADGARFDVAMGPDGSRSFPMGSETEFVTRLERAGALAWHAAEAKIGHLIRSQEMSDAAVVERARRHGAGFARMLEPTAGGRTLQGVPLWLWRGYWHNRASSLGARISFSKKALLRARYRAAWHQAAVDEMKSRHRSRGEPSARSIPTPTAAPGPPSSHA